MAIDNKDKKVLKSSIEREQNEVACSAECEKIKGSKNLNVPHLRFPEFSGEWKMATFGDIAKGFDYGMNAAAKSFDGNNKYIRITDIDEVSSQYLYDDVVSPDGELEDRYLVKENDILLARTGASTGKSYLYRNSDGKLYFAGFLIRANIYKHNSYFVFSQLHTLRYKKWISVMSARSGQPGINSQEYASFPVYTTSLQEEDKIATFLKLLDERIITQNKIIEKLQSLIKGLRVCCMQRVYGNNVYLSEIAQIYQPQTISSTELTEDGFLVYGANGIIGKYKDYNHETEQICITCRGNTCGMVNYTKPMSWITGNAMVINTDKYQDKVCKRYLYHYLSAYNFNSIISGSGQPQIVRTPLEKLKITLPTISEQKQKAIIFDKIQDKIDINHKVLNLYIGQKQYLLRQMFI